jgi:hypothetical protein
MAASVIPRRWIRFKRAEQAERVAQAFRRYEKIAALPPAVARARFFHTFGTPAMPAGSHLVILSRAKACPEPMEGNLSLGCVGIALLAQSHRVQSAISNRQSATGCVVPARRGKWCVLRGEAGDFAVSFCFLGWPQPRRPATLKQNPVLSPALRRLREFAVPTRRTR